jgi:hypothetical protein
MHGTDSANNGGVNTDGLLTPPAARENANDAEEVAEGAWRQATLFLRRKRYIESYYKMRAEASPSLKVFEPTISSKIAKFYVSLFAAQRRIFLILIVLLLGYIIIIHFALRHRGVRFSTFTELDLIGIAIIYAIAGALFWMVLHPRQEGLAMARLFNIVYSLEKKPIQWPNSRFRWQIARRLEVIARKVERIPLTSRGLAPTVKSEALRMSRAKAQAIRQLELWAIRPMAFTFTDLVQRLTSDLCKMVDDRWYDLPEADDFRIERSKWFFALQIGGVVLIIGATIALAAFAAKLGSAASILVVILPALAVALLNNIGISTSVIDRYIQTGSKIVPSK